MTRPISTHLGGWLRHTALLLLVFLPWLVQAQTITSFTPTQGAPSTQVTITGTGFTGASAVNFNGVSAAFFVSNDQSIITQVPVGASTGKISVTVGANTAVSVDDFTVLGATPSVSSFSPVQGAVGATVNLQGTNLNLVDSIHFNNGARATFVLQSITSINATVPVGAISGPITIFYQGIGYTTVNSFTVVQIAPTITGFTPTQGNTGSTVNVTGSNFIAPLTVTLNGVACPNVTITSPTDLSFVVPANATSGQIRVINTAGQGISRGIFTVLNATAPTITNFNPFNGPIGTSVTINGTNFQNLSQVLINGIQCPVTNSTNTQIVITIPTGATTGNFVVVTQGGTAVSQNQFTVTGTGAGLCFTGNPQNYNLQGFSNQWTTAGNAPAVGNATTYTFLGNVQNTYDFRICTPGVALRIYNQANNLLAESDNNGGPYCTAGASVTFTPTNAGIYRLLVTASTCSALQTQVAMEYKIGQISNVPTITSFTPTSGIIGTTVTVLGTSLLAATGVSLNGVAGTISALTNTNLIFNVPAGATTGPIEIQYAGGSVSTAPNNFTVLAAGAGFCLPNPTFRGQLTPSTAWATATGAAGAGSYWEFNANVGTTYQFSTCASTRDTRILIYNAGGTLIDSADNNGPFCNGLAASMTFRPTMAGTYRVLLVEANCSPLTVATGLEYRTGSALAITSFAPTNGPISTPVTIQGTGFQNVQYVRFGGGVNATYTVQDVNTIRATVPAGAITGEICIKANGDSTCSTNLFVVVPTPTFCGTATTPETIFPILNPRNTTIPAGERKLFYVTATAGTPYRFSTCGSTAGNTRIRIYDPAGTVLADNDDNGTVCNPSLLASLDYTPATSQSLYILVTEASCDPLANTTSFDYMTLVPPVPPVVTTFNPLAGFGGDTISILGRHFTAASVVTFSNNAVAGWFQVVSDTLIRAVVPGSAVTGRVSVTTPNGTGTSAGNFTISTCVGRIVVQIVPNTSNLFSFRAFQQGGTPGPQPVFTFRLNGVALPGANNNTVSYGRHILRATNPNTGCFQEIAFNYQQLTCGSRIAHTGMGADSVSFYEVVPGVRGQTHTVIFDEGSAPRQARFVANNQTYAQITDAGFNSTNLTFTINNQPLGTAAFLEVIARAGTTGGGYLMCPVVTTNLININQAAAAATCNNFLVHANYPNRDNNASRFSRTITPQTAGSSVQLRAAAFNLANTDTLVIINGPTATGAVLGTLTGKFENLTQTVFTSTAPGGELTISYRRGAAQSAGFIFQIGCVSNTTPAITLANLTTTSFCPGTQLDLEYSLSGPITLPASASILMSDGSGSFTNATTIGAGSATATSGTLTGVVPTTAAAGNYKIRLRIDTVNSADVNVTVNALPVEPTITLLGNDTICQGGAVTLRATSTQAGVGFLWSTGATSSSISVFQSSVVSLRAVANGCTSQVSAPVTITVINPQTPTVTYTNDTLRTTPVAGATYQWLLNNGTITGANNYFYVPTTSGTYTLRISIAGCPVQSAAVVVLSLSKLSASDLKLYPNPSTGIAYLEGDEALLNLAQDIVLVNTLGQQVRSFNSSTVENGRKELNLSGINPGTYWVRIPGSNFRKTLVVQ